MDRRYDYRNCQSLFGYAARVHERSGGVCQLCGAGAGAIDFDLWRQFTVEHLIGESQQGHRGQIRELLKARFPLLAPDQIDELTGRIDEANTVTACSFCNATTSRDQNGKGMAELLAASDDPEEAVRLTVEALRSVLERKRADVAWKLRAVRAAFDDAIGPRLQDARLRGGAP